MQVGAKAVRPGNEGRRYPADPPRTEEIIAVCEPPEAPHMVFAYAV